MGPQRDGVARSRAVGLLPRESARDSVRRQHGDKRIELEAEFLVPGDRLAHARQGNRHIGRREGRASREGETDEVDGAPVVCAREEERAFSRGLMAGRLVNEDIAPVESGSS